MEYLCCLVRALYVSYMWVVRGVCTLAVLLANLMGDYNINNISIKTKAL